MLPLIRRNIHPLARIHLVLFALVWSLVVATPCAMAMQSAPAAETAHECPHCPPEPCHQVQPDDCDDGDWLDAPRLSEQSGQWLAPPAVAGWTIVEPRRTTHERFPYDSPPVRAGPRAHLLNAQFNE